MEEVNMDSILNSVKKFLGIGADYKNFDVDLIMHINTAFAVLTQMGVGPSNGFMIEDESSEWSEFYIENNLNIIRSFVYLKVKLLFDPPTSNALLESANNMLREYEWRLFVECDSME